MAGNGEISANGEMKANNISSMKAGQPAAKMSLVAAWRRWQLAGS
jgi:hypothetical protein